MKLKKFIIATAFCTSTLSATALLAIEHTCNDEYEGQAFSQVIINYGTPGPVCQYGEETERTSEFVIPTPTIGKQHPGGIWWHLGDDAYLCGVGTKGTASSCEFIKVKD